MKLWFFQLTREDDKLKRELCETQRLRYVGISSGRHFLSLDRAQEYTCYACLSVA